MTPVQHAQLLTGSTEKTLTEASLRCRWQLKSRRLGAVEVVVEAAEVVVETEEETAGEAEGEVVSAAVTEAHEKTGTEAVVVSVAVTETGGVQTLPVAIQISPGDNSAIAVARISLVAKEEMVAVDVEVMVGVAVAAVEAVFVEVIEVVGEEGEGETEVGETVEVVHDPINSFLPHQMLGTLSCVCV